MSTKITINVSGNRLLQQSREAQTANRQQLTQKEVDDKFLADVRQIEATAPAPREGAVPEYRIAEQTSAQRSGDLMGGWLDINRLDQYLNRSAITPIKLDTQFNVGSGDGTKWATVRWTTDQPANSVSDGPPVQVDLFFTAFSYSYLNLKTFRDLPPNADIFTTDPIEADLTQQNLANLDQFIEISRTANLLLKATSTADRRNDMNYLIYPIDASKAILTIRGCRYLVGDASQVVACTEPNSRYGVTLNLDTGSQRTTIEFTSFWEIPPGYSNEYRGPDGSFRQLANNTAEPLYAQFFWFYVVLDNNGGLLATTAAIEAYYGLDNPAPAEAFGIREEKNMAFVISHNNVREIPIPETLLARYRARWPLYEFFSGTFNLNKNPGLLPNYVWQPSRLYQVWRQNSMSSHMGTSSNARADLLLTRYGLGIAWDNTNSNFTSRYEEEAYPGDYLMGSPGIYDYDDNEFDDWKFSSPWNAYVTYFGGVAGSLPKPEPRVKAVTSSYAPASGVPLFAPDHTKQNSGFASVYGSRFKVGSEPEPQGFPRLPTQIYKWLFLTPEQRDDALAFYPRGSIYNDEIRGYLYPADPQYWQSINAPSNPSFYYGYFKQTNAGVVNDWAQLSEPGSTGNSHGWVPASTQYINTEDYTSFAFWGGYKYVDNNFWQRAPEVTKLSPQRKLPPNLSDSNGGLHPYITLYDDARDESGNYDNETRLSMIFWSAWGRNWRSKLLDLGFTAADLTP